MSDAIPSRLGQAQANGDAWALFKQNYTAETITSFVENYKLDGRVSVRNIRRTAKQALEKLEKDGEVGKDDVTGAEKRLDAMTKTHTDKIDELLKHKEAELLEV